MTNLGGQFLTEANMAGYFSHSQIPTRPEGTTIPSLSPPNWPDHHQGVHSPELPADLPSNGFSFTSFLNSTEPYQTPMPTHTIYQPTPVMATAAVPLISTDPASFHSMPYNPLDVLQEEMRSAQTAALGSHWFGGLSSAHPYSQFFSRHKSSTREATSVLKAWMKEHKKNPYPTKGEKVMLAVMTRMTMTQVSTWFANARRRMKKERRESISSRESDDDMSDLGVKPLRIDEDNLNSDESRDSVSTVSTNGEQRKPLKELDFSDHESEQPRCPALPCVESLFRFTHNSKDNNDLYGDEHKENIRPSSSCSDSDSFSDISNENQISTAYKSQLEVPESETKSVLGPSKDLNNRNDKSDSRIWSISDIMG